jgi:hypothetical protein
MVAQRRANSCRTCSPRWGRPETAIVISSDLSHFHDYNTATAKDAETTVAIERLNAAGCDGDRAVGGLRHGFFVGGAAICASRRWMCAIPATREGFATGSWVVAVRVEYAHSAQLDAQHAALFDLSREVIGLAAQNGGARRSSSSKGRCRVTFGQRATFDPED